MSERPEGRPAEDPQRGSQGESDVWSVISTLLAGPAVWGAAGFGVDRLLGGSDRVFLPVGVVVGFVISFYIVYVRHFRSEGGPPPPSSGDAR